MSVSTRPSFARYVVVLLPAVVLFFIAVLINMHRQEVDRAQRAVDQARLIAVTVDLRFGQLLEVASFCASSPALIERVDLDSVVESCGRYASQIGAWVVLIQTGDMHRQLLNTRPDAPSVLPVYPRDNEHGSLVSLEERSRRSGQPGMGDVFTGIILQEGIITAGQYLRLADGRDAMVYVGFSARALSDQLAELAVSAGPIFGLIDPSRRFVARSVATEDGSFAAAPEWILPFMETDTEGAALAVPLDAGGTGPTWDVGYKSVSVAPGWMAVAFQPSVSRSIIWSPLSLPSAVIFVGMLLSGLLLWVMLYRDRTARRVAAADRRNREKSRLLASFAHDIRSPLISLIGSLELTGEQRESLNDQVRSARVSAEMLLQLVDDILELSFLGSGEMTLHPSPVDLRQLSAGLLDQIRPLAARNGLELRLELDPELPIGVEVDRLRLQQVLSNLLTNAVKYTERGSVTLKIIVGEMEEGRVTLDFAVIDTGVGLAQEDVPQILREFGRLEREVERHRQGSGLGLAIVQRILQRMGTALEVKSALGHGSTFQMRLTLPIPTGEALLDVSRPLSGISILYVEDEPVIRQMTVRRLEEAGAHVISAVDGTEALKQLETTNPDLLLIDLQMPVLDGVGLIRCLKEIYPDRFHQIFVLTSHISGTQASKARLAGADAVFTKPVQVSAIAAAFRARRGEAGQSTPKTGNTVEANDNPLLDLEIVKELVKIMGSQGAVALVTEFEEAMNFDCATLWSAIGVGDMALCSQIAHHALGRCLAMGTVTLAILLREIEEATSEGDAKSAFDLANKLRPILRSTLQELRSTIEPLA